MVECKLPKLDVASSSLVVRSSFFPRNRSIMGKRLYVGNLSWDTNEDSVRAAFEEDGRTVTDVHLVSDRDTGRPRGFGFVEMSTDQEAQAAIDALDGVELDGRSIKVNEAQERQPRGGGGHRGGGGGGSW